MDAIAPFSLALPREILFGRGRAAEAPERIASFGARVLVAHGRDAARARRLLEGLAGAGCSVETVACPKEPDIALVEAATEAARRADVVVGFGGGAVIDLAKAAAALAPAPGGLFDHLEVVGRGRPLAADPLPFVAIPTTAGAGAEATKNAVIDAPEHRRKVSLRDPRMLARLALVDPALADGCPRGVTLASGLDALAQVIEPYLCSRANPAVDALCRDAIPRGLAALKRLMEAEDAAARDAMAFVALTGGVALSNAGLGVVHGLAGPIGGRSGAAHGAICGRLLPFALDLNGARVQPGSETARRIAQVRGWIAEALGAPEAEATRALALWSGAQGLAGLTAMGLDPAEHGEIARAAAASSSMKANPATLSPDDLEALLASAA